MSSLEKKILLKENQEQDCPLGIKEIIKNIFCALRESLHNPYTVQNREKSIYSDGRPNAELGRPSYRY
jgi:hypothetical protein